MLSDITTGDGKEITRNAWNGIFSETDCRQTSCDWPEWKTLNNLWVKEWQDALRKCLCWTRERVLEVNLGHWIESPSSGWKWFVDAVEGNLYYRTSTGWESFKSLGRETRTRRYEVAGKSCTEPPMDRLEQTTDRITSR